MLGICEHCGGPNPIGAEVCQWCGVPLPLPTAPTAPPLDVEPAPEGIDADESYFEQGPRRSILARVAALVVVVIVLLVLVATSNPPAQTVPNGPVCCGSEPESGPVNVSLIQVNSPDNACGVNGAVAGAFSTSAGATHPVVWWLPLHGASVPCTVQSVVSNTRGFTLSGDYPLTVTSDQTPLLINIYVPSSYNGILNLTVS